MKKCPMPGRLLLSTALLFLIFSADSSAADKVDQPMTISWVSGPPKSTVNMSQLGDIEYRISSDAQIKKVYWSVEIDYPVGGSGKLATLRIDADDRPKHEAAISAGSGTIKMADTRAFVLSTTQMLGRYGEATFRIAFHLEPQKHLKKEERKLPISNWLSAPVRLDPASLALPK